jgi:hypothetical protein
MKKIFLIKFLAVLILGCSDRGDKPVEYRFEIINDSGVDLKILSYNPENPDIVRKSIEIEDNDVYLESFNSRYSEEAYFFSDVFNGDSIVINYGNEKQQFFYCLRDHDDGTDEGCNEPRNILAMFEDSDGNPNDGIILNRYTFSSTDFENASPCEADCE